MTLKINVSYTAQVVCDRCERPGASLAKPSRAEAVASLEEYGWELDVDGRDICSSCQEELARAAFERQGLMRSLIRQAMGGQEAE